MEALRATLLDRRRMALFLITLALALKALVPAGFMLAQQGAVITVSICGDATGTHLTRQILVPGRETPSEQSARHDKGAACPFGSLHMAGTPGADPILLTLALAFIVAAGLILVVAPRFATCAYLRPPLRGPPLLS